MTKRVSVDGRTRPAKSQRATYAALIGQLGGEGVVTPAQRLACRNAATTATELETWNAIALRGGMIDAALIGRLRNSLTRQLQAIGLDRANAKPAAETVTQYLARKQGASA